MSMLSVRNLFGGGCGRFFSYRMAELFAKDGGVM